MLALDKGFPRLAYFYPIYGNRYPISRMQKRTQFVDFGGPAQRDSKKGGRGTQTRHPLRRWSYRVYATHMIDQETRRLALQTFRDVLNSTSAKAADKLRAAEGVLKLEAEEKDQGLSDVLDANDEELLNRARGTHDKTEKESLEAFVSGE